MNCTPFFLSNYQNDSGDAPVTTLDFVIEQGLPSPDVMKVDIEGEEYKFLLGAEKLFHTRPPQLVLLETHSEELFYQCLKFLQRFPYDVYHLGCPKINTGGDIYPMSYKLNTDVFTTKSEGRMILAVKKDTYEPR